MRVAFRIAAVVALQASLLFVGVSARAGDPGAPSPLTRVGTSDKICQLIGDVDWESGKPTQARTFTHYGLDAADLGYPVDLGKKLVLLFGDSWPAGHPVGTPADLPPDDSVGITTRRDAPTEKDCLELKINDTGTSPEHFAPATIVHTPAIEQGFFNVPSGGVGVAGDLYAFFWTNHCVMPTHLAPSASDPLSLPAPTKKCPETSAQNSLGIGVMAHSSDDGRTFTDVVTMPSGFVYATAMNSAAHADLPADQRLGVFIFAAARYRASVPYLAYAPAGSLDNTSKWRFFTGRDSSGQPKWVTLAAWNGGHSHPWAPPGDAEVFTPDSDAQRCIGEFSVTWNKPLRMWLMLFQCPGGVQGRVAAAPWGPWSEPFTLLSLADKVECHLIMSPKGCGTQRNYWPGKTSGGTVTPGGFYAPYVLNRYTADAGSTYDSHETTIYWTLSTWNPYVVSIMRTTLQTTWSATPWPHIRPTIPPGEGPAPRPTVR